MPPSAEAAPPPAVADRPGRGILLMVTVVALFAGVDAIAKMLAVAADQPMHPLQIAWARYLFTALLLAPVLLRRGPARVLATERPGLQLARAVCMLGSAVFFMFAVAALPIADATAIGFVWPLLVTALSIPLLGERIGLRRWLAGFAGVLLVIRPGGEAFDPAALYPLLGALCWALGLIVTRRMAIRNAAAALTTLSHTILLGLGATTALVGFVWTPPTPTAWLLMAAIGTLSALGHFLLIRAAGYSPASLLAPFAYSQIVWATLFGLAVFGSFPDLWTGLGATITVASGLYMLHRERLQQAA